MIKLGTYFYQLVQMESSLTISVPSSYGLSHLSIYCIALVVRLCGKLFNLYNASSFIGTVTSTFVIRIISSCARLKTA